MGKLIEALDIYIQNYYVWNADQLRKHWCEQVGGTQLTVPAHIVNEYSHPNRPNGFTGCQWGKDESILPRTGVDSWYASMKKMVDNNQNYTNTLLLGQDFAHYRRGCDKFQEHNGANNRQNIDDLKIDYHAMKELRFARIYQAAQLLLSILTEDNNLRLRNMLYDLKIDLQEALEDSNRYAAKKDPDFTRKAFTLLWSTPNSSIRSPSKFKGWNISKYGIPKNWMDDVEMVLSELKKFDLKI